AEGAFPAIGRRPLMKGSPCCARHIAPLAATLGMLDEVGSSQVMSARVELGFDPVATAAFREHPATAAEARFSVPYVLTAACRDGDVTPDSFTAESFA